MAAASSGSGGWLIGILFHFFLNVWQYEAGILCVGVETKKLGHKVSADGLEPHSGQRNCSILCGSKCALAVVEAPPKT